MADRVNSLLADLKRLKVETGSLACMGCGREHNCGVHGCAVLREAADVLQEYVDLSKRYADEVVELREAADVLQEYVDLSKRYADEVVALREWPWWISVTERLPAEGERVLAAVEGAWVGEAYRDMRDTWMRSYGTPWDASIGVSVTHWMPLPDAPRGKELSCRDDT